jgi:hypothetical protein
MLPCSIAPGSDPPMCVVHKMRMIRDQVQFEGHMIDVWRCAKTWEIVRE